ncbi:MAG: TolC family protein, partial [Verrucomicrobia bacterium]|nr:TolC family protein [Verrucomicrobiota bacterium]
TADVDRTLALFNASGLLYERQCQRVVFNIQRHYFAHEAALHQQDASRSIADATRTIAETIQREVQTGLSATTESLRAKKNQLQADAELASANALVQTTLGDLAIATGLPPNTPLLLRKPQFPKSTTSLLAKVDKLINLALANRPDIQARTAELRAHQAEVAAAQANFFPVIRLQGSLDAAAFQYQATGGKSHGSYREEPNGYTAFLTAKWDIFDGFERTEKLRKKRAELASASQDLQTAQLDASRDVWVAYQSYLTNIVRIQSAEGFVAAAEENFLSAKTSSESGLLTIAEFSEATAQLALAHSTHATALADYSTSLAALIFATGTKKTATH